jgi:hypothetical protein
MIIDDDSGEKIFETLPPPTLRQEFKTHIEETNRPETFPGLSRTKPDLEGSQIIHRFKVDGKRRPNDFIPCSACNNQPKFFDGAFIWSPDGRIRLIGHCCASASGGEAYQLMQKDYEDKEQAERNIQFLEENLKRAPHVLSELKKLEDVCRVLREHRNAFKAHLKPLQACINKAFKHGGKLTVAIAHEASEVRREIFKGRGNTEYEIETVHLLSGREFLDGGFNPNRECQDLMAYFEGLIRPSEYDYFSMIADASEDNARLAAFARGYRENITRVAKLHERAKNAAGFFGRSNLEGLKKYGAHQQTDLPFAVIIEAGGVSFKVGDQTRFTALTLGPVFQVPDISLP